MAFDVMGVVESEVLGPVARLGQLEDGPQKRGIICVPFQWGNLHLRTVGQFSLGREHHHAILDSAFEAHANCLAHYARQRKRCRDWQSKSEYQLVRSFLSTGT